jgi:microcin C transport system permease protein
MSYTFKRILLIIPTLFGALFLNFCLLKVLPGGSSDYLTAKMYGLEKEALSVSNLSIEGDFPLIHNPPVAQVSSSIFKEFLVFSKRSLVFDFGRSLSKDVSVKILILEKIPLSLSLGLFALAVSYILSIFAGLQKAKNPGTWFDKITTGIFIGFEAIPSFLLSVIFIMLFAGGFYWQWFPVGGMSSIICESLPWYKVVFDYGYHLLLPFIILMVQGLGQSVFFVKGAFLEESEKPYVQGVYARGGSKKYAFYHHMLPHVLFSMLSHLPSIFMGSFFMRTLIVEMVFSLDGFGLLLLNAILERDCPLILGSFFIFILIGLVIQLLVDLLSLKLDPRVHFNRLEKI